MIRVIAQTVFGGLNFFAWICVIAGLVLAFVAFLNACGIDIRWLIQIR